MPQSQTIIATLFFYEDSDITLHHETHTLALSPAGRAIIPAHLKHGRSIIAVCEGKVEVLNKMGDRLIPIEGVA